MHAALARMQPLAQRVALNYVVRYQVGQRGELIMLLENVWLFLTTTWKEEKRGGGVLGRGLLHSGSVAKRSSNNAEI